VKAPVVEASATVFPVKTTAGYGFDIVDGTKKARFTKILKQKWTELLIFNCFTGKEAKPVIRIDNTGWRIRRYPPDLTAYAAQGAPLARRKAVTGFVHGYAGNGVGVKQALNVVANP
jgi:hypothetical protein